MPTYAIRCKYDYHRLGVNQLTTFAVGVSDGIFDNSALFPSPPVTKPALQALINSYITKRGGYKAGFNPRAEAGMAEKDLIKALDSIAHYVNQIAAGNEIIIITAGFRVTKAKSSRSNAPGLVEGIELIRSHGYELTADCDVNPLAESYGAMLVEGRPLPVGFFITPEGQFKMDAATMNGITYYIDLHKTRRKVFKPLKAGVTYYVYYWAVNAAGIGPLSEAVSKMAVDK